MREDQTLFELETLVDLLRWRASRTPDRLAYTYLVDDVETSFTLGELDRQARAIAELLLQKIRPGDRALLLYPPGLEYIAAFFGCLYAGVIAIPAYPPRRNRSISRLQSIVSDANAAVVLTTGAVLPRISAIVAQDDQMKSLPCLSTDGLAADKGSSWQRPAIHGNTLAFLQYTSGSTADPKGVMVSHSNLLHNQKMLQEAFCTTEESIILGWLPIYHDMGLIGNMLHPLYIGARCIFMSPAAFLHTPFRWLRAMSHYKATLSPAPNFAYELCVRKISPEQRATLDLSHWRVAVNGAEPIRAATLESFVQAFAPCGFRREAFYPMYGLAESTLVVSGKYFGESPKTSTFQKAGFKSNRALGTTSNNAETRQLVSCGGPYLDQKIVIVSPETLEPCRPGDVGEIWVSGPSVAQGYWNRPEATQRTFQARLASGEGPFLRTGDLGIVEANQLYVTGRLKDMIIIRGQNHYPQDIELTMESAHPSLRCGCGAAFSVEDHGEEQLVIVQEVEHGIQLDYASIMDSIRRAVTEEHALQVHAMAFLKTGSIPKTSSGKIQRHACKEQFLNGTLKTIRDWRAGAPPTQASAPGPLVNTSRPLASTDVSSDEIRKWLVTELASRVHVQPGEIDTRQPFSNYGLDSAESVKLSGDLERWLGRHVPPTLAWDFPTIEAVAMHLGQQEVRLSTPVSSHGSRSQHTEPIAIIGLSCRFPGADDPEAFWRLLREGADTITEAPADRWNVNELYDPNLSSPGKMNTRWGGFVKKIGEFDPIFFGLSAREASSMDPQQRLLLEVTWEALERSGIAPKRLEGSRTGVFIGISSCDYYKLHASAPSRAGTGVANSIAANRISYFFDFHGPSMVVDSACSSSLVALHLACQNLHSGESDMALAAGVNLIISPELTVTFSQAGMMAADGRCKTFDEKADGYVRGEGCGVVLLKRLSDALADGDNILALVRGSAVNQDGRSNGLTAPNGLAQQEVIRQALKQAGVSPHEISYIEAHGSGTPLGDAIEVQALRAVYAEERPDNQPCMLGSVKTNIGHLEAAAGIAGLIKVVLSLKHGRVPPHLHLKKINPHLELDEKKLRIPTALTPWPGYFATRLAGISSFGFGGTNAHVIVEQAAPVEPTQCEVERPLHMLTLSAKSESSLKAISSRLHRSLTEENSPALEDICYTANTGRTLFPHRLAIIAQSRIGLRDQLASFAAGEKSAGVFYKHASDSRPSTVFVFSDTALHETMGKALYQTQPTFRDAIDQCNTLIRPLLGLRPPPSGEKHNGISFKQQSGYAHCALFSFQYALAQLWMSWGINPHAVMGYGLGEFTGACIAGVFSLETALRVVIERAHIVDYFSARLDKTNVLGDSFSVVTRLSGTSAAIAVSNGLSGGAALGSSQSVAEMSDHAESGLSDQTPPGLGSDMYTLLQEFEDRARRFSYHEPQVPIVSSLTGEKIEAGKIPGASYWRNQICESANSHKSIQATAAIERAIYLEIGPSGTRLNKPLLECTGNAWISSLQEGKQEWDAILEATARLHLAGLEVDWEGFDRHYSRRRVMLPTYAFQKRQCWLDPSEIHQPKLG